MAVNADCVVLKGFTYTSSLPASPDCCSWPFVTCTNGAVSGLNLADGKVQGAIPSDFGKLTQLTSVYAPNNALTGPLPDLSGLVNLDYINFSNNKLTGKFPMSLLQLPKIRSVWMYTNGFDGPISSDLGKASSSLTEINFGTNSLSGEIPSSIGDLSKLSILHLDANQLTGAVPDSIKQLRLLTEFWVNENQLTSIPDMSGLKNLQNVQLFKNKLAGKAPSLPSPSTNCTIISPFGETNKFDCYAGTTTSGLCYKEIAVLPLCKTSGGGGGDPTATTNSLSPTASSTASSSSSDTSSGSGSTVAIAVGASLGAVLLLSAIAAFAFFRLKASARRSAKDVTPVPSSDYHHHGGAPYPPSVQQQQPNAMFQHMSTYPSSSPSLPSYDVAGGRQPSMPLFEAAPAGSPLLGPASPAVPYPHYSQPPTTTISGAVATVGSENGNGGSNGDMFKGVNVPPKPENRKLGNTSHMGSSESLLLAPSSAFGSAPLEQDLGDHEDMFLPETPRG